MASIESNGAGFTRLTNWLMTVASGVAILGIGAIVAFAWNTNGTVSRIETRLEQQDRRDQEQDRWLEYFRSRIDGHRRQRTGLRGSGDDD